MTGALHVAHLGLGSNLGDRATNLTDALARLQAMDRIRVTTVSSFYETAPVGKTDQPDFVNACCEIETRLAPRALLDALLAVESEMGRRRAQRWGPRVIDLDVLLIDGLVIDEDGLQIPHPEMLSRAFVLVPLAEIAPDAVHPLDGRNIRRLADSVDGTGGVTKVTPGA